MNKVNNHQAKTHSSEYLDHVTSAPLPRPRQAKRPIGLVKNKLKIPKSFLKPLPDELLDAFEGNQ
jgi:hypothetical protein